MSKSRLIDTLTREEVHSRLSPFFSDTIFVHHAAPRLSEDLERLFAKAPHWSDNLESEDPSTWMLCFVSDHSSKATRQAKWIHRVSGGGYIGGGCEWKYATPIDLNLRFWEGEE